MIVVFDSLTGQSKRFALKLGYQCFDIKDYTGIPNDDIFLVTRSFNFGQIPPTTIIFLEKYHSSVVGVAVSGNRNWGTNYGRAGNRIEELYQIPLILKFEASGLKKDVDTIIAWLKEYQERRD